MSALNLFAFLATSIAIFGFINAKYTKMPYTIAMVVIALVTSMIIITIDHFAPGVAIAPLIGNMVHQIDLYNVLMNGILCALLFANALETDFQALKKEAIPILFLSTIGVLLSTFLVGGLLWLTLPLIGLSLPFIWCLVFGSLISPTDPVAVAGLLKVVKVPENLKAVIGGESMFNDGVGVVVFTIMVAFAMNYGGETLDAFTIVKLFTAEAFGGALVGGVFGAIALLMLRKLNEPVVELNITLALAVTTYSVAQMLHMSGPIGVVVAGLIISYYGRKYAMQHSTQHHVTEVWEFIDNYLNSILFLLIGFEVLVITFTDTTLALSGLAVIIALFARWASVALPVYGLRALHTFNTGAITLLTWGGLRGGVSVALALSLPTTEYKPIILAATLAVVVWTVVVQGITMKSLVLKFYPQDEAK